MGKMLQIINRSKNTNLYACKCFYLILSRIIQLKLLGNLNHWNTYLKPTKIYSKVFALINRKNKRSSQKTERYVLKRRVQKKVPSEKYRNYKNVFQLSFSSKINKVLYKN
ncbi:hypothetical protein BpHYR1_018987 [Brachionus plicatilis]|uniref:Uncharacterized protein n=1 Tax=Brachionus plicatilis TaxID=10195 RepID=A0A3M7Q4D9_BRAPC|nr:hypothetical protein BpHYR1_018987 [Brachionus plicatilis]